MGYVVWYFYILLFPSTVAGLFGKGKLDVEMEMGKRRAVELRGPYKGKGTSEAPFVIRIPFHSV